MKRILASGACALILGLLSSQPASAWVNWKFGVGLNSSWQSGGNNFFWGLYRNGQPPGPDPYANLYGLPGCQGPGCNPYQFPGGPYPYGPADFQYFGNQQQDPSNDVGRQGSPGVMPPAQLPTNATAGYGANPYGNSYYRPVSGYQPFYPAYYGNGYGR